MQWGAGIDLGVQYGGFLSRCQQATGGKTTDAVYEATRACVRTMCDNAFGAERVSRTGAGGRATLHRACHWFVDWYQMADNPNMRYRRVVCPSVVDERAGTGQFAG